MERTCWGAGPGAVEPVLGCRVGPCNGCVAGWWSRSEVKVQFEGPWASPRGALEVTPAPEEGWPRSPGVVGGREPVQGPGASGGEGRHAPLTSLLPAAAHHGPTMWAGTNSGSVFAYALEVPTAAAGTEKRPEPAVEAVLGKEVQLMHRAPVVAIAVLDGRGRPLPEPYEASRDLAQAPDMQGGHAVLIASEEQFKVSRRATLPGSRLHPFC